MQLRRLSKKLARRGLRRKPAEDTRAFLRRIDASGYPQRDRLARIIELYNRIKYGRDADSESALADLRSLVNDIR